MELTITLSQVEREELREAIIDRIAHCYKLGNADKETVETLVLLQNKILGVTK